MWYTYEQRMYMDCIYIYMSLRAWVSLSCVCVLAELLVIRRVLFSLKWDKQQVLLGEHGMSHGMSQHQSSSQFHLDVTYHTTMWYILMSMTSNFSFSSQYLSHPFASNDANIHYASSDASPIYLSIQFSFPSRPCFQPWLFYQSNRIFKPFLHQFFIPNVNWLGLTKSYVKSMTSVTTRMTIICRKPHCTLYKSDNVYVQSLPTSSWGLPSRWSNWRGISAIIFARPTLSRSST